MYGLVARARHVLSLRKVAPPGEDVCPPHRARIARKDVLGRHLSPAFLVQIGMDERCALACC